MICGGFGVWVNRRGRRHIEAGPGCRGKVAIDVSDSLSRDGGNFRLGTDAWNGQLKARGSHSPPRSSGCSTNIA